MNIIVITMEVLPGKQKELLQTMQSLVGQILKENGCLCVSFCKRMWDENLFVLVEQWATAEAAGAHLSSENFIVLQGAASLLREKPKIVNHTVMESAIL